MHDNCTFSNLPTLKSVVQRLEGGSELVYVRKMWCAVIRNDVSGRTNQAKHGVSDRRRRRCRRRCSLFVVVVVVVVVLSVALPSIRPSVLLPSVRPSFRPSLPWSFAPSRGRSFRPSVDK